MARDKLIIIKVFPPPNRFLGVLKPLDISVVELAGHYLPH